MQRPVPFSRTERVNDLRVALSTVETLARDAPCDRDTMKAIQNAARHALDRDAARAAVSQEK